MTYVTWRTVPADCFLESLWECVHCPRRRRWLICTPWLSIPFLLRKSIERAARNRRSRTQMRRIKILCDAGDFTGALAGIAKTLDGMKWNPSACKRE